MTEVGKAVAQILNRRAFDHAKALVRAGKVVFDEMDAWDAHKPSPQKENEFIRLFGFGEYAKWYLGINDEYGEANKGRYEFPYGDFKNVHRCGVLFAASRAGENRRQDIEKAVAQLLEMIDSRKL